MAKKKAKKFEKRAFFRGSDKTTLTECYSVYYRQHENEPPCAGFEIFDGSHQIWMYFNKKTKKGLLNFIKDLQKVANKL